MLKKGQESRLLSGGEDPHEPLTDGNSSPSALGISIFGMDAGMGVGPSLGTILRGSAWQWAGTSGLAATHGPGRCWRFHHSDLRGQEGRGQQQCCHNGWF